MCYVHAKSEKSRILINDPLIPTDYYPPKQEVFGICISDYMLDTDNEESFFKNGCAEIEELADGAIINRFKSIFDSR